MNPALLAAATEPRSFTVEGPQVSLQLVFSDNFVLNITESIIVQWIAMIILSVLFIILGRNLKVRPTSRRQVIAEFIVNFFHSSVTDNMGPQYKNYISYIAAVFCMSLLGSLAGLFGMRSPTSDLAVVGTWAVITFFLTQYNCLKTGGIKGFFKRFIEPMPFMLPFNIIGEFSNPMSQALRHFGNILSGSVIGGLIYFALGGFAKGLFSIGIPAVLSLYFDIFSSVIQAYIFITLTMAYVSGAERDEVALRRARKKQQAEKAA